jgi:5-enolpyruvylshikimate-3-phosphate synthase
VCAVCAVRRVRVRRASKLKGFCFVLAGEAVSQPFIEMTIKVMQQFGVKVVDTSKEDKISWFIPRGVYHNPKVPTITSRRVSCVVD